MNVCPGARPACRVPGHIPLLSGFTDFDKTNLPDDLVLSNYFSVRDGKIVSLVVIRNTDPDY
jgi:hypothetical protein